MSERVRLGKGRLPAPAEDRGGVSHAGSRLIHSDEVAVSQNPLALAVLKYQGQIGGAERSHDRVRIKGFGSRKTHMLLYDFAKPRGRLMTGEKTHLFRRASGLFQGFEENLPGAIRTGQHHSPRCGAI